MRAIHPSTNQPDPSVRSAGGPRSAAVDGESRSFDTAAQPDEGAAYFIQGYRVSADEMRAAMRRRDAAQAGADRTSVA